MKIEQVKSQVLKALHHPEAEDGLYFRNLYRLHEEDSRQPVTAEKDEILTALNLLVEEGKIELDQSAGELTFHLAR